MKVWKRFLALSESLLTPDLDAEPQALPVSSATGSHDFIAVDVSGSMSERDIEPNRLLAACEAVTAFVEGTFRHSPKTKLALIAYNNGAKVVVEPSYAESSAVRIRSELGALSADGGTAQGRAMKIVLDWTIANPSAGPVRLILLTDGHSNGGPSPLLLAEQLKERGVTLCMIGVGKCPTRVNESDLKSCASTVGGVLQYWFIKDAPDLIRRFRSFVLAQV
jgi:Mg-chelatase subunit ChlD